LPSTSSPIITNWPLIEAQTRVAGGAEAEQGVVPVMDIEDGFGRNLLMVCELFLSG
jgi:hypothetical protein